MISKCLRRAAGSVSLPRATSERSPRHVFEKFLSFRRFTQPRAFMEIERNPDAYRPPVERLDDWAEIAPAPSTRDPLERKNQASRCMDCGTPFCQTHTGCPVNNFIPEWNELVSKDNWRAAIDRLHATNNFPEFTGRVCPAPCEGACVLGLIDKPVTIKNIEYAIVDHAFQQGWVVPRFPPHRTDFRIAVVGSGPAGLACADICNQKGHSVTVFEREDRVGGLLVYGIPNMKLDKGTVERRVNLLAEEGIEFVTRANVDAEQLRVDFDAVVLCTGSTVPRDLRVPGRDLDGIHFAMEFLTKNQKRLLVTRDGKIESGWDGSFVDAHNKNVVVIGGGDTGTDCIGTSMRQRCKSLTNFELLSQPPPTRAATNPWPQYPRVYNVDYGHDEVRAVFGRDPREYRLLTKEFRGDGEGKLKSIVTTEVDMTNGQIVPVKGTEREWPCDLAILAMGFLHPESELPQALGADFDERMNIRAAYGDYRTTKEGVFAAGDCRRGQSLVVWAIHEGRGVAQAVEKYYRQKQGGRMNGHSNGYSNGYNGYKGMNGVNGVNKMNGVNRMNGSNSWPTMNGGR